MPRKQPVLQMPDFGPIDVGAHTSQASVDARPPTVRKEHKARKAKVRKKAAQPSRDEAESPAATGLKKLKGISVRQPHAEEVMLGKKPIEYRTIPTNFRGDVYIYASQQMAQGYSADEYADLPRGKVIGIVEIFDCEDLGDGQFGWHLRKPRPLTKPVTPTDRPQPVWFHPFGAP